MKQQRHDKGIQLGDKRYSELSEEERELLVLRIDRKMEWRDIAQVLYGEEDQPGKRVAMLRKRFSRLTVKLRKRARESGLLDKG